MTLLLRLTLEDSYDFDKCKSVATILYAIMAAHHGAEKTQRLFRNFGPLKGADLKYSKKIGLAFELAQMPERNIRKLAAALAEKNKGLPRSERYGLGTTDVETMRRHINRLLKNPEFCAYVEEIKQVSRELRAIKAQQPAAQKLIS
jgi:hypothetical protein